MATLLVTGGSGFVARHTVLQALQAGHRVRATVRSKARAAGLEALVAERAPDAVGRFELAEADLLADAGWRDAASGVDAVLHVASPLIATRDEQEVIKPAVEGTLRVLGAARDAGVRRVVMTSSCGAVYYGHPTRTEPFDEASWTDVEGGGMSPYVKSKALSERAAWDFAGREGLELTTVCPTGIFGPTLGSDVPSSVRLVQQLLDGKPPACPDLWFCVVDVRDVADLHLRAAASPAAIGERFIASSGPSVSMLTVASVLRRELGDRAGKVPTRALPSWLFRAVGLFNVEVRDLTPLLGKVRNVTTEKARARLDWTPRPWEEAIVASAESLLAR